MTQHVHMQLEERNRKLYFATNFAAIVLQYDSYRRTITFAQKRSFRYSYIRSDTMLNLNCSQQKSVWQKLVYCR